MNKSFAKGFHVTCRNARLYEISLNLSNFLQTTNHQNLIVDLSSNFLSRIPCHFFRISTIITLVLTKNRIESFPSCFSQSTIETLLLNDNHLRFNQTTVLSSSKLLHLDISSNQISELPRTFFTHLRRLRRLIINDEKELFQINKDQWLRSLTTRNQLTLIICNENLHLPLCLFDSLFQSKRLLAIELNRHVHCDCSLVYLPREKIHLNHCQVEGETICHPQTSRFERGHSWIYLQEEKYRQICTEEYQTCRNLPAIEEKQLTTSEKNLPLIRSSLINQTIATSTIVIITSSRKENITAGAIISFVLVLLIVTIVCLYVILSGHLFQMKNRPRTTDLIVRKKKQQDIPSATKHPLEECISIDNLNMNFNPQKTSFRSYDQGTNSDEESDLTFYSLANNNHSSTSFIQSSTTEIEVASLTSTIDSSPSNETVVLSHRNKERIN